MTALESLRIKASYATLVPLWGNVLLQVLTGMFGSLGLSLPALVASIGIALVATLFWMKDKAAPTTRIVNSMALGAQVALLVYGFSGSPYQIDMHMYFFATLAISAVWIDWRAIVAYAALVAVHHVALFVLLPAAVFPGQSDFGRVLLHAVILVLQTGALIGLTSAVVRAFEAADTAARQSNAAERQAAELAVEAQRAGEEAIAERSAHEADKAEEAARVDLAVDLLGRALAQLSEGDLGVRIAEPLHGRIDGLRQSFNQSLEKLEAALSEVGHAAQTVRGDASAIQGANDVLSTRTERQAVSVEQTAAALTQISDAVSGTAKLADQVAGMVEKTKVGAERSASIVTDAVSAMSRIEESSNRIGQIIGVIDEIAFQTNLLALNAGVEAARAGEAGKGFAVVAQEVRELAQRSANAAKEIKSLINASAEQVRHGVDLVGETGAALKAIEGEVRDISQEIAQIVLAARDQSNGIGNINQALGVIDQNTQQFAGMVEESAAAVSSLVTEASRLESLLARFSMHAAGQRLSRSAPRRAA